MPTFLNRGTTWLGDKLRLAAGRSIAYRRGLSSIPIVAVGVRHRRGVFGPDNLQNIITTYEWQIKASDLILDAAVFEPRPGDVIAETTGGITIKYQVLDLDESTPCWEFLDEAGIEIIVHTKRVR